MYANVQLSRIAADLNGTQSAVWVPNAMSTVQIILVSPFSSISDLFQSRKLLIVGSTVVAFIGAAIAPGSQSINRLIAGQCLIGFGLAALPLSFTVAGEILPKRWRPSKFDTENSLGERKIANRQLRL